MPLLSVSQLGAIRNLGIMGMTTAIDIYPTVFDAGLDLTDDPYGSELENATTHTTVVGWLVGSWARDRSAGFGDLNTISIYKLRLPVGTTIKVGWTVKVADHVYNVMDVGNDQTWPEWLTVIVRRSE